MTEKDLEKLDEIMCSVLDKNVPEFTYEIEKQRYVSGQRKALQEVMKLCIAEVEK